jgi:hypothetical protein
MVFLPYQAIAPLGPFRIACPHRRRCGAGNVLQYGTSGFSGGDCRGKPYPRHYRWFRLGFLAMCSYTVGM